MILVRVEIWPGGDGRRRREIARMAVANVSELAEVSDYVAVRWHNEGEFDAVLVKRHRRSVGIWPLLARACSPRASRAVPGQHLPAIEAIVERAFLRDTAAQ